MTSDRLRQAEVREQADMIMVTADPDGVETAAEGTFAFDTTTNILYINTDGATAWARGGFSEKSWAFNSPQGSTGSFYVGGYYDFGATPNDFAPALAWGTANASYAAHFFIVTGAVPGGNVTIRVTGTSITDAAVRVAVDTEDIVVTAGTAVDTYFETSKKWIGQVEISVFAGTPFDNNYGWAKYWDNGNRNFTVRGLEAVWLGGANDANADIHLHHHRATGWTFNAGAPPDEPTPIATLQVDHNTEYEVRNNEHGAWKRTNLSTAVAGSSSEGTLIEIVNTANRAFELGTFLLTISPG